MTISIWIINIIIISKLRNTENIFKNININNTEDNLHEINIKNPFIRRKF